MNKKPNAAQQLLGSIGVAEAKTELDVCVMCDVPEGRVRYCGEVSRRDNDDVLFTGAWQDTPEAAKSEARAAAVALASRATPRHSYGAAMTHPTWSARAFTGHAASTIFCGETPVAEAGGFGQAGEECEAIAAQIVAGMNEVASLRVSHAELMKALERLEVAANTVSYCYEKRPENFAAALRDMREDAEAARSAIAAAKDLT